MIEKAVCNASPLIFLAKINKLNLLEGYTLYVPTQVKAEIQKGFVNKKENTGQIIEFIESNNIEVMRGTLLKNLPDSLGSGEKAVISLALKTDIKRVLIDEAKARIVARFKGLCPRGILWNVYILKITMMFIYWPEWHMRAKNSIPNCPLLNPGYDA